MDTQIGTRPQIGALEIHQAYILASLNWLQQTRSLEMNHVAIEKASRVKLRYSTNRGVLSVEDLWDLSLEQLDPIAINLNKRLKESQTESFIKTRTKDTTELELKFNIVKHIIDVKLQEQEDRLLESEKKAKRQKILDLMAKKQDAELEGKSLEELAKELEALN